MALLEEGLLRVNISNAMELESPMASLDIMNIDLFTVGATLLFTGIPIPSLIRSTNSASLVVMPDTLV